MLEKFKKYNPVPTIPILLFVCGAVSLYLMSLLFAVIFVVAGVGMFAIYQRKPISYPFRVPAHLNMPDPSEYSHSGESILGKGILLLGHEKETEKEIWLTGADMRQHFLVLGSTGSGKTELLLSMAANTIEAGGGCIYFESNGDLATYARIYDICRKVGREHDLFVLNFHYAVDGMPKNSHKWNPLESSSSSSITSMLVSMLDNYGGDGGAMWRGRAVAMLSGVVNALVWLRDNRGLELDVGVLRDFMNLKRIVELSKEDGEYAIPLNVRKSICLYLTSLPGYVEAKGSLQAQTTLDQHGYLEMQFCQILGSLSDVYGHIFKGKSDFTISEIHESRRILLIFLPALEKSSDEISNLGKLVISGIKGTMANTLGSNLEGSWDEVIDNRRKHTDYPFMCIMDNLGYYTVDGMALMAAQARSLGFSMVYASQDISAMKRNSEKEANSIIANTNTKIFMRIEEDLTESLTGGEKTVSSKYLRNQKQGEMTMVTNGKVIKAQTIPSNKQTIDRINNVVNYSVQFPKKEESIIASTNTKLFMRTGEHEK